MAQPSTISEKLKQLIGKEAEPTVWEVEKGAIRKFAQAIDDPNPLWNEEKEARKTRCGGIITPPTFFTFFGELGLEQQAMALDLPQKRALNGGNELEYFQPVRPGDVITVTGKLAEIREREGRMGRMLFLLQELTYKNQFDELVAIGRNTIILY